MIIQRFLFLFCLIGVSVLPSCWWSATTQPAGKQQGLIVINVLDKKLYDDCHITGSINVTLDTLEPFMQDVDKDAAEIVIYCSNYLCTTSEFVGKKLLAAGYKHVQVYEGGMAEWYQMGLPTVGIAQSGYLQKVVEPSVQEHHEVPVITAQQLLQKMRTSKWAAA